MGAREDPYSVKQANYIFYQQISKECQCSKLERITFPEYSKISTTGESDESVLDKSGKVSEGTEKDTSSKSNDHLPGMLTLSSSPDLLPLYSSWSLVCLGASSLYSHNLGVLNLYTVGRHSLLYFRIVGVTSSRLLEFHELPSTLGRHSLFQIETKLAAR